MNIMRQTRFQRGFQPIENNIDHLLHTLFTIHPKSTPENNDPSNNIQIDMSESADNVVVKANVPGTNPEDIQITLEDTELSITGHVNKHDDIPGSNLVTERQSGSFSRTFSVPINTDPTKSEASLDNGVLTITLPKKEEVKPKHIQIKPS